MNSLEALIMNLVVFFLKHLIFNFLICRNTLSQSLHHNLLPSTILDKTAVVEKNGNCAHRFPSPLKKTPSRE